ncbi:ethylbenzene dehydrogenase-related protein [Salisediminibacterium halotolerans]|uniref:Ethylbenzene dehydrogenase n=1 Tax=Salisediminibacterium halotolerans TaxID=517425 RepID=A0A1H9U8X0_9BACI|nr:ethylbenzene dehydrogenase-related protein [Salisediminibacterium haloalkalitolerans]SES05594.1 Ethylbenzene dehydrogenase [Salisediminibacterium haloalkalitolerans]
MKAGKLFIIYFLIGALAVGLTGGFMSTGVIEDDHDRNIEIPDETMDELQLKAAYNGEDIFWRFEWEADDGYYHDYLVYEDGEWEQYGESPVGSDPHGVYEDRLTFLIDDGSVDHFSSSGGFMTVTEGMRYMTSMADADDAAEHVDRDWVRKFLPETREDPDDWRTMKDDDELEDLVDAGYFLDFWHWRAHRSNPVGHAEDTHLLQDRVADEGDMFDTNWDDENEQPEYMYDPDSAGMHALEWDKVVDREYTQDDYYYLGPDNMTEFDPDHEWEDGDTLPRRPLEEPSGSRADIFANGVWDDGKWHLDLERAMDTGNPDEDKIFHEQGVYDIAFAVHKNATGTRWHYVSFPMTFGFERGADIDVHHFEGDTPPWDEIEWETVDLVYPGQITWEHANDPENHAGAGAVQNEQHMGSFHSEEDFSYYGIESEFREEIMLQWGLTTAAVSVFVVLFSIGVIRTARIERRDDE